jgi:mannose-6-phosphate isomerase-like protein (cupin superfamily)
MKKTPITCNRETGVAKQKGKKSHVYNKSKLYKYKGNFSWKGIKIEKYKKTGRGWSDIVRQTLIGNHGETTKFHLRYFEIAPGGYSSFEMHRHEHVVIGIRGKGLCIVRNRRSAGVGKTYDIGFLDMLYIEPGAPHQLRNTFSEPFGFFCIVNAKRDRPKILE